MKTHGRIESLEARIAPAAVLTFTDVDGDTVTVKTSKGTAADLTPLVKTEAMGMGVAIREIDLSMAWTVFDGTDLSVLVTKKGEAGDGKVNVRLIDGEGVLDGNDMNLGVVTVEGDVGCISAGRNDGLAVKSFRSLSFGVADAAMYTLNGRPSFLKGDLGSVVISGLMQNVSFNFDDATSFSIGQMDYSSIFATGDVQKVSVLGDIKTSAIKADSFGSVTLNTLTNPNTVSSVSEFGKLTIRGTTNEFVEIGGGSIGKLIAKQGFAGGVSAGALKSAVITGDFTGVINAASLDSLVVKGNVQGAKVETGYVSVSGNVGSIKVRGDVLGGLAEETGFIEVGGNVGSIRIGGSLKGFSALGVGTPLSELDDCGSIQIGGNLDRLFIGKDLVGTSIIAVGKLSDTTGAVIVQGNLGNAVIGGSILAGAELQPGLQSSGTIQVGKNLGSLLVKGDIVGGFNNLAIISALGADNAPNTLAIGKIVVRGDVTAATFRVGDAGNEIINQTDSRDESIGSVKIGGDLVRSTILAGQTGAVNAADITARIAKIVIGGTATGGDMNTAYGILAEEVGSLRVNGKNIPLQAGKLNDIKINLDPNGNTILAEKLS